MKVTREVIYDLLPAYFANEVSADTRALIEEFFATDPEFGRMAARFQTLLDDRRRAPEPETEAARERHTFDRARLAAELPLKARAAAGIWAIAAVFSWAIAFVTWNERMGFRNPGVILGVVFLGGAVVTFVASFYVRPDSWWRPLIALDDANLETIWIRRRRRIGSGGLR